MNRFRNKLVRPFGGWRSSLNLQTNSYLPAEGKHRGFPFQMPEMSFFVTPLREMITRYLLGSLPKSVSCPFSMGLM